MSVPAETLRAHLDYTTWATNRLLDAARSLTAEEQARDFGTTDKSVLGTLTHVFAADRIWLGRIRGGPPEWFRFPDPFDLPGLTNEWGGILAGLRDWAAGQTDDSVRAECSYKDMKGNAWVSPFWQIVLHVVNHGTHHRGQVAGFLRALGHAPPPLDLIAFYRGQGRSAGR
jgi:uncharacterized damage-inducible protein DinB